MRHFITISFFLFCIHASAQIYPVQATAQLMPPYTPYLSDYTLPGAQKLMLQVRLNDPTVSSYQCKLRITIEGVGITLRTKQSIFLNPITLQGGGIPQLFYGEDLEEYFRPANLDFSGLSRTQYEKGASLPEGVYRFTIEVLDYNRNTVVSNKAMAVAWMVLNDPPLLNLPFRETKIQQINPTNIPFTWTPRHTGSPNAAFSTEYIFRLVEMAPGTPSSLAQNAIMSQPALYEETTTQTQLVYGMAAPALIPGRKYAWQVQANDVDGKDLFKNSGRSEVYVFQFGDALGVPENMYLQSANSSALTVRWEQNMPQTAPQTFRVSYRPHKNRSTEQWYEVQTTEQWKAITQLKPDTEYEIKVRVEQSTLVGEYNPVQVYRTVPLGASEFVCKSDVPPVPIPTGALPLFQLSINDTIKAGGYDVLVRNVSGSNGRYTGEGVAIVPFFNAAKVRVTFKNISVNSDFWLTAGVIESVWDADSKNLINVPATSPTTPGSTPKTGDIPITIAATDSLIKITGAAIASVTKDAEGNIVVSTTDGKQQVLEKGKSYSVVDDIGSGYVIDKDGNVAKTTAEQAVAAAERGDRKYNIALRFEKGEGQYGFDAPPASDAEALLLNQYQELDGGKHVAWKLVKSGTSDKVSAIVENASLDKSKIAFEMNGSPIASTSSLSFDINAQGDGVVTELLAHYDKGKDVIGKLNVISYNEKPYHLVLIPVNNNKLSLTRDLATQLNAIYRQAAVTWTVKLDDNLDVSLNNTFDDGASDLLSNYTDDMKKVINAYTKNHTLQHDTYYLFLVSNASSNQNGETKLGYMPRKKQAGFLFVDKLEDNDKAIKTIAHELGHGAFRLKHPFSEYSIPKGKTDNLMDYSETGTHLRKYQWDYVHDPEAMISLFDDDEEGASKNLLNSKYVIVHDQLSDTAYASTKGEDVFTQEGLNEVDSTLDQLFKIDKKTYIYFAYVYFNTEAQVNSLDDYIDSGFRTASDSVKKHTGESNFNLLVIFNAKYDRSVRKDSLKTVSFREKFYPMSGLDAVCTKSINDYLVSSERKRFVDGLDEALTERALKLYELLKDCEVNTNLGEARALLARKMDIEDTRLYQTPVLMPGKLTDKFVDCSEFTNEIALSQQVDITYGSDEQLKWFKANGTWGTNWNEAKVGDVIFWDRQYRECDAIDKLTGICMCERKSKNKFYKDVSSKDDIDHVGIIVEYDETTKTGKVVHASVQRMVNPSINESELFNNGNIYDNSCDQMTFIAWGRIEK